MSNDSTAEKTEQPTQRKLEDAQKKGQFPKSGEVQTIFVLGGGMLALVFTGGELWTRLGDSMTHFLSHLHDMPVSVNSFPDFAVRCFMLLVLAVWPILLTTVGAGLLAGGIQTRFRTASEALTANWAKLNPVEGLKRVFSFRSAFPSLLAVLKLSVVIGLTYGVVRQLLDDPIFSTPIDVVRIADFMGTSSFRIVMRVLLCLAVIAAMDYGYQIWRTNQDLLMSKQEVKDELKNSEGNPEIKSKRRRQQQGITKRKMLAEVPQADVVVTNPTHLAVALRYDRRTMKAPKVIAKGSRLNALRIREIAKQHQVPLLENKPLARTLFRHAKVGGEIPAQLYVAVAEVLAWVYRVNAYRYYREQGR